MNGDTAARGAASIEILHNGRVAPLTSLEPAGKGKKGIFDGGAYYRDGELCGRGLQLKSAYENRPAVLAGDAVQERVQGRHLFCGMLQNGHFGHCMVESLSRLWAVRHLEGALDSLAFYLRTPGRPIARFANEIFELIAPKLQVRVVSCPTEFELLVVPEQLAHPTLGVISGHPANRDLVAPLRSVRSDGPRKVYVSRSRLKQHEGGVLLETLIEENLEREGYAVIHPQELSIREQLGIYNSAEKLVFAEGSALHLYAFVARAEQRVFVVWRRKLGRTFDWHVNAFGGPPVQGTPCIKKVYVPELDFGAMVRARALLDFHALKSQLAEGSFIDGSSWQAPTDSDCEADLSRIRSAAKHAFVEHPAP
jgi:Glycosyltransferase 61